jgi:hypothetical protein
VGAQYLLRLVSFAVRIRIAKDRRHCGYPLFIKNVGVQCFYILEKKWVSNIPSNIPQYSSKGFPQGVCPGFFMRKWVSRVLNSEIQNKWVSNYLSYLSNYLSYIFGMCMKELYGQD